MKRAIRILLPLAIVALGVVGARALIQMRPQAKQAPREKDPPTVEVMVAAPRTAVARVEGSGVVTPAARVVLQPQVTGRVVRQDERLAPGGRFLAGETLLEIERRDYELAVRQAQARVRQAEVEVRLEASRQRIAEKEWALVGEDLQTDRDRELALRKPQFAAALANLESAKSALEKARLDLSRTRLVAPFNAMVVEENVDVGQTVGPQSAVATLIGTDRFWVTVSIPVEDLRALRLPGPDGEPGSPATVVQVLGDGQRVERRGEVLRVAGPLDPATRTARVVVGIDEPLAGDGLPLLPEAFVEVEIEGRAIDDAYVVPRRALVRGDHVWIVDGEGRLASRRLDIAWREDDSVIVTGGLSAGDKVVLTPLALPIEGMPVVVEEGGATARREL